MSRRVVLIGIALVALGSCRRKEPDRPLASPREALSRVVAAARSSNMVQLFGLLDRNTRYSVMSVHRDHKKICELVRARYPKQLQARELSRCHAAASTRDARAFFVAYSARHRDDIIEPLLRFGLESVKQQDQKQGPRVELASGNGRLAFCKEDGGWCYCGLRERFDQLKLKAARDLTTVRENSESYR